MVRDQNPLAGKRRGRTPRSGGLLTLASVLFIAPFLSGCPHWLLPPLRVLDCSLEDGGVRVLFSAAPTEISVHKAFSMAEDGQTLEGHFVFEGDGLGFYPVNGIRENREYTVSVGVIAEDRWGNSLEQEYRQEFFTGTEREAPRVESIVPAEGSTLAETPDEIRLRFSESVDPGSLEDALRIIPAFPYALRWEEDYRELSIRPLKPLDYGKRYAVSVSTALRDRSRNAMAAPFAGGFLMEGGRLSPGFGLEWSGAAGAGPLNPGAENRGLSTDAELRIRFDMEVETESLAGFVEIQPSLALSIDTGRGSRSEAAIRLGKPPEWGETYTLIVRKGISAVRGGKTAEDLAYALVFDAPESRPPRFLRGFFQDTAQVLSQDTDFGCISLAAEKFPSTDPATTKPAELCLVFAISGAASSITPSSAMAAFAISPSNGCARFSIKTLKVLDEAGYRADTFNDPSLAAEAGEKLYALVYGLEVENTKDPGLVVFSIAPSIEDSLGNTLGKGVTITWNKQQ